MKNNLALKLAVGLVHHPIYNKQGDIVTTSVTTLDVHDMARLCRTYGVGGLYIVTPLRSQARLVERLTRHWTHGWGAEYNPSRKEALARVKVVDTVDDMIDNFSFDGGDVKIITTGAKTSEDAISYPQAREELKTTDKAALLFGTGYGLAPPVVDSADIRLEAIKGMDDYNHLPVRCAAAIILDRLLGNGR